MARAGSHIRDQASAVALDGCFSRSRWLKQPANAWPTFTPLRKLEELDLREPLGIREEPVHLLVPIVVVDELDNLKHDKDRHKRWRARYSLQVLDGRLADPTIPARLREADFSPIHDGGTPCGELTVEILFDWNVPD